MKQTKKIFFIIIFFSIMIFIKDSKVQAASAGLSASTTQPTSGQAVTVTGTATAGAWNLTLSGNGQSKTIYGYTSVNGNATGSDSITFTAGAVGTKYTFTLVGGITDINSNTEEPVNKSITIEVIPSSNGGGEHSGGGSTSSGGANSGGATTPAETPAPSNNANLSNLGIRTYDFKGFRAANTSYNASVPNEVTAVEVYANVQAAGAKYSVSGNKNLQVGTNKVTVTVTAPDGKTTKNYYIYVARQPGEEPTVIPNVIEEPEKPEEKPEEDKKEKIGLISIAIDEKYEIYLEPEFKTDVYEYVINLKEDLASIPITAIANRENAEVKITGNEELVEGENVITIEVKDPVLEETTVYTIKVNKILETEAETEEQEEEKTEESSFFKENWMIIAAVIVAILLITISIVGAVIMKKNRENEMFFKEEDNEVQKENIEEKGRRGRHY